MFTRRRGDAEGVWQGGFAALFFSLRPLRLCAHFSDGEFLAGVTGMDDMEVKADALEGAFDAV
ncbi:MAG TPA: hypothetical protein PKD99_06460, partial [Sphingopyxis sp.]|nr:hypothetical protein [Sphingopyxis sp.]